MSDLERLRGPGEVVVAPPRTRLVALAPREAQAGTLSHNERYRASGSVRAAAGLQFEKTGSNLGDEPGGGLPIYTCSRGSGLNGDITVEPDQMDFGQLG
jgi:hypothetical protein